MSQALMTWSPGNAGLSLCNGEFLGDCSITPQTPAHPPAEQQRADRPHKLALDFIPAHAKML